IQALRLSLRSCPSYSFRSPPSKPKPFSRASASMPSSTKARFPRKRWWRSGATFTRDRSSAEGYQVVSHAHPAIRLEHFEPGRFLDADLMEVENDDGRDPFAIEQGLGGR